MTNFQRKFDLTFVARKRTIVQMKKIPLTQGKFALVDDADFDWLNEWNWYAVKGRRTFYAQRPRLVAEASGPAVIQMHRLVLPDTVEIDHKDGDGLNNQRGNLRAATRRQNQHNRKKRLHTSSTYKGVCWNSWNGAWAASIRVCGKLRHLGYSPDERTAARAYDAAALKHFGEFARVNFP